MSAITRTDQRHNEILINPAWLDAPRSYKDERSRVSAFVAWLDERGDDWHAPDMAAYRDYLLRSRELSPASVQAHLSTIRGRYAALLLDNSVRDLLYAATPTASTAADRKAFVDEALTRMQNAVHPSTAPVAVVEVQDDADSDHLRLTPEQVQQLLSAPGMDTRRGIRDSAVIALLACTGIREAELCDVRVRDLRESLNGELALRVREGKGKKQRVIPYGALDWCLLYVEKWLSVAGISTPDSFVFRGLYKNGKPRSGKMTARSLIRMLAGYTIPSDRPNAGQHTGGYPLLLDGTLRYVRPHDLRRSYARNAYLAGLPIEEIRQNLGHNDVTTTQRYIGKLDADRRRAPAMYAPALPLDRLAALTSIE